MKQLLMGDEAVALAAIHSGIGGAFSYPGTPATEILEFIEHRASTDPTIVASWSPNEKVAYEEALGMSYVGKRAIVSMKHVGLNVAADPFMSSALTGANGGLVVVVADDPGMHSSQNEQDTRYYGQFAQIPIFEPSNQQQAYDMTREAFLLSERVGLPVLVRLVTRLAHSRADIVTRPAVEPPARDRATDWHEWTLIPSNARKRYARLLKLQPELHDYVEKSGHNRLTLRGSKGVIVTGIADNYFQEAFGGDHKFSVLHITAYPVSPRLVRELVDHCDEITILEEGYPFVERQLVGLLGIPGRTIRGKLNGCVPAQGELTTEIVKRAVDGLSPAPARAVDPLPGRPPQLCQGCPHCDTYHAVVEAAGHDVRPFFFSDIGCYSLAAMPPYNAIDTCVDMGASIGMAIGAAKAGAHPVIATIGDSTFVHSGMNGLIAAAFDDVNMTVVILDNAIVAMTGGQEVFATGEDMIRLIKGLGVPKDQIIELTPVPTALEENVRKLRRAIDHRGLSVVVSHRACIHAKRRAEATPLSTARNA